MSSLRPSFIFLVLGLLAPLTLGACSTQPLKVSCEKHLTPINVPPSKAVEPTHGR